MLDTASVTSVRRMTLPELLEFVASHPPARPPTVDAALAERAIRLLSFAVPEEVCDIAANVGSAPVLRAISDRILAAYPPDVFTSRCGFGKIAQLVEAFAKRTELADPRVAKIAEVTEGSVREPLEDLVTFYEAGRKMKVKMAESLEESIASALRSRLVLDAPTAKKKENVIFSLDDKKIKGEDLPSSSTLVKSIECLSHRRSGVTERGDLLWTVLKLRSQIDFSIEDIIRLVIAASAVDDRELLYRYRALLRAEIGRVKDMTGRCAFEGLKAAIAVGLHDQTTQRRLFNAVIKSENSELISSALTYSESFGSWTSERLRSFAGDLVLSTARSPVGVVGCAIRGSTRCIRKYCNFVSANHLARILLTSQVRKSRSTFHAILDAVKRSDGDWVEDVATFLIFGQLRPSSLKPPSAVDRYCNIFEVPSGDEKPPRLVPRAMASKKGCAVSKVHVKCEVCEKARLRLFAAMCQKGLWRF